jgi:5'-nucleotidase
MMIRAHYKLGRKSASLLSAVLLLVLLSACGGNSRPAIFSLTLVHLNDTHSHLEPEEVKLAIGGVTTGAQLGGFARIKTALDLMRAEDPNLLVLHGGDAVQGTLYFTLFNGTVEYDFLNLLGVDAMTFGNHEFDRGTASIPGWINRSKFPWLSANIDFSAEPAIEPLVTPYLVKERQGEKVAIIGVTTESTPLTTLDAGKAVFKDAVESTRQQVAALAAQGINKIILLSHLGYAQDKALAAQLSGIDIIVGGHSHSLLGNEPDLATLGLAPSGPYPTELLAPDGKRVLVLQAWQWGDLLGNLGVTFSADGEVLSYRSRTVIPLGDSFTRNGELVPPDSEPYREIISSLNQSGSGRIIAEDPAVLALLAPYAKQVEDFGSVLVATAADDIVRGLNSGPGPLAADSMLNALPKAQVALLNYGGMRQDLEAGAISVGDVLKTMPFGNTLVLADLNGTELKQALEEGIGFLLGRYPDRQPPAMPYVAGIRFNVRPTAAEGLRVSGVEVKDSEGNYQPLESDATYRTVVNTFVAGGGDGFTAIKNAAGFRSDTGIIDSDAFRDYLKGLGTVYNPTEQRITIFTATGLIFRDAPVPADGYWAGPATTNLRRLSHKQW